MANHSNSVKAPRGGASIWVDGSSGAIVLNNEFFGVPVANSIAIKLGTLQISNIKLGTIQVQKVYLGNNLISQ